MVSVPAEAGAAACIPKLLALMTCDVESVDTASRTKDPLALLPAASATVLTQAELTSCILELLTTAACDVESTWTTCRAKDPLLLPTTYVSSKAQIAFAIGAELSAWMQTGQKDQRLSTGGSRLLRLEQRWYLHCAKCTVHEHVRPCIRPALACCSVPERAYHETSAVCMPR